MSTFLQLVQRLARETGVAGVGPLTVVGQTGEAGRLVNWISDAWNDIQTAHQDWQWLRTRASFVTVAGQALYTPAQCGIAVDTFGMWARDTFRNYVNPVVTISLASPGVVTLSSHGLSVGQTAALATTGALPTGLVAGTTYFVQSAPTADTFTLSATSGGAAINTSGTQSGVHTITSNSTSSFVGLKSEIEMDYTQYETWRQAYDLGALKLTRTRPFEMSITPAKEISLGPYPDVGYTITGDYYTAPVTLAVDSDTPAMPAQFHMAIVWRACMSYGAYESAPEVYQRGETEFGKLMRRMTADRINEPTFQGALA